LPFVIIGGFDLSPIVVMVVIFGLQKVVVESLQLFAYRLDVTAMLGVVTG